MSRNRKRTIAPIVIGVVGVAILLWLGSWQVQRLAWKEGVIAQLEARAGAEPVALPATPDRTRDNYLRVQVAGMLEPAEIDILTSIKNVGPGFRIVAPMVLENGRRILVDLGFVPEALKDLEARVSSARRPGSATPATVTGILYWPGEKDSFTPAPDQKRQMWFAWDLPAMATALGTEAIMVVATNHPGGDMPLPRPPGVDLPNNHLEYALTWFGLAIVWAIMSIVWFRAERRKAHGTP